jgi:hypothetical protein
MSDDAHRRYQSNRHGSRAHEDAIEEIGRASDSGGAFSCLTIGPFTDLKSLVS